MSRFDNTNCDEPTLGRIINGERVPYDVYRKSETYSKAEVDQMLGITPDGAFSGQATKDDIDNLFNFGGNS